MSRLNDKVLVLKTSHTYVVLWRRQKMMLMPSNWGCVFCFPRLLFGAGQSDGSSDLQHQQHDRTGALHAAGPPLAAPGRKAYSLMRCRSLHAAHTLTQRHTSVSCAQQHVHGQANIELCTVCTQSSSGPPLTYTHVMNFSDNFPTLCPFPTPACQKHWAIPSTIDSTTQGEASELQHRNKKKLIATLHVSAKPIR